MQYNEMAQAALKKMAGGNAVILAIETSCDETAAAVVRNGREVLGSSIYSQIPVHREYGGVVPELASRNHVEKLPFVVDEALSQAGMKLEDVDALAVTQGPGLVGALLTGVAYAKALAFALKKPLIPVNRSLAYTIVSSSKSKVISYSFIRFNTYLHLSPRTHSGMPQLFGNIITFFCVYFKYPSQSNKYIPG